MLQLNNKVHFFSSWFGFSLYKLIFVLKFVFFFFLNHYFTLESTRLAVQRRDQQEDFSGRQVTGLLLVGQGPWKRVPGSEPDRFLSCCAWVTDFLLVSVVMRLQSPIGFSLFPACKTQGRIQAHPGNHLICLSGWADLHGMTATTFSRSWPSLTLYLALRNEPFYVFILICSILLFWSF